MDAPTAEELSQAAIKTEDALRTALAVLTGAIDDFEGYHWTVAARRNNEFGRAVDKITDVLGEPRWRGPLER